MKKDIVNTDEFSALVDEIWGIIRQAATQVKSEKEENKMTKTEVKYIPLAADSYHYSGYDISDPWGFYGYTYTRENRPNDRIRYADRPVTHIELRPDVFVKYNGPDGAEVEWAADMPCPFVFMPEF